MRIICEKVTSFKTETQEISAFFLFQKWRWLNKMFRYLFFLDSLLSFCFSFQSFVCHKNMLLTILRIYS